MNDTILALDTGTSQTGYCIIDTSTYSPLQFGKIDNEEILKIIDKFEGQDVVFERFAPQSTIGMSTVTSIVWYGRFIERCFYNKLEVHEIFRRDVKKHFLGTFHKANGSADSQMRKALIKRFAKFDFKNGKGNKEKHDWFYGMATTDVYAAYACGICWIDTSKGLTFERRM